MESFEACAVIIGGSVAAGQFVATGRSVGAVVALGGLLVLALGYLLLLLLALGGLLLLLDGALLLLRLWLVCCCCRCVVFCCCGTKQKLFLLGSNCLLNEIRRTIKYILILLL